LKGVGVVAALAAEARALGPWDETLVAVSGIGCSLAGAAARTLIESRVSALMTFGLAGGLDPSLETGCIVLPGELISRDGARFHTSQLWRERIVAALGSSMAVTQSTLLTSPAAIDTPTAKAAAFRDTGAAAVDMESVAVAEVAAIHKLPFIAVRVIVDTATDVLPPAVLAASRAGRVQIGRLLAGLIVAPGEIAALIRLALRYRTAMRALRTIGPRLS
jgi:adenosylhomocysteine nucleosidase